MKNEKDWIIFLFNELPWAIRFGVNCFIVIPAATIFVFLLISVDYEPSAAAITLSEITQENFFFIWQVIGWSAFTILLAFKYLLSTFNNNGEYVKYFQEVIGKKAEDESLPSDFITHGVIYKNRKLKFLEKLSNKNAQLITDLLEESKKEYLNKTTLKV